MTQDQLDRKLYVVRRRAEAEVAATNIRERDFFYVPSMSSRTIVYKGLMLAPQIAEFYRELSDPETISAMCMVHQRFSTNTFPSWQLAHPYRYICHNGEINTVRGNVNWMNARESVLVTNAFGDDIRKIFPVIQPGASDTGSLDNAVEMLTLAGRSLPHVMAMLIPEAWDADSTMPAEKRAFYEYHASLMEPWDGPAAVAFTDGKWIGATLDRFGLRPARYLVTEDDHLILASETGVLPVKPEDVRYKGRLQPGKMLLVDWKQGRIVPDEEIKARTGRAPAIRRVAGGESDYARCAAAAAASLRLRSENHRHAAAGVRIHGRRSARDSGADGVDGRGAGGVHGHRYAARVPVGPAAAAVPLLQAAFRTSDQSGDRSDS